LQILDLQNNSIISIAAVENLTKLEELYLSDNQIISTNSLSELINLRRLELANNFIFNIQPLVDNLGLAEGDFVSLGGNPLSENSKILLIPILEGRGVTVDLITF
jgi:Leucine-rich repeat (LRR) protein